MLLIPIVLILSFSAEAQDVERTLVQGKISAPKGEDTEGINIYNVSSQKGAVTDADGVFTLEVAENDRVQITAIHFQSFTVIIDRGVIDAKNMRIYMNPAINQLDEVIVRPYDLFGNINVDVKRIRTSATSVDWDLSYEALEFGYDFAPDHFTEVTGNAAEEALGHSKQKGANILGLIGLLFPKKKKPVKEVLTRKEILTRALRHRFSNTFITENFDIPEALVNDFIYFTEENGISAELLRSENELELIEFIYRQSLLYKAQIESE